MIQKSTILNLLGGPQVITGRMLVEDQSTGDIIQAMLSKHEQCRADYDKFSFLFDVGSVYDICQALFDFCKSNISYQVEKSKAQYISSPRTILSRGYSDCKGYALFCAGVCDSLRRKGKRIDWAFRFASYKVFKKEPYHVFVVVKDTSQAAGGNSAIYLDPVFDVFNYKKVPMWRQDYNGKLFKKQPAASIAGMCADGQGKLHVLSDADCFDDIGPYMGSTTTAQTGQQILKVSGALAAIPVAGWIAAAAGSIAGGLLAIFGDTHQQSSSVLWLVQLYEEKVQGRTGITASNADDNLTQQAQAWFSVVVGVPIGEREDFNILQTGDTNSNHPSSLSDQQRGQLYLNWKGAAVQGKVDLATATAAAHIAASMNPYNAGPGAWKNLLAAPWTIQGQQAAAQSAAPGGSTLASLFSNKWLMIILIGAGLGLLLYPSHPKK